METGRNEGRLGTSGILQKGTIELSGCSHGYPSRRENNYLKVNSEIIEALPPLKVQGLRLIALWFQNWGPLFGFSVPGDHCRELCGQPHRAVGRCYHSRGLGGQSAEPKSISPEPQGLLEFPSTGFGLP